jgi:hypothetical protein
MRGIEEVRSSTEAKREGGHIHHLRNLIKEERKGEGEAQVHPHLHLDLHRHQSQRSLHLWVLLIQINPLILKGWRIQAENRSNLKLMKND